MSNGNPTLLRIAAVLLAAVVMRFFSFGADDLLSIRKGIRSDDTAERTKAYAAIENLEGDERKKAVVLLEGEHRKRRDDCREASSKIENLLKGYGKGIERKEELRKKWEKAAREAMEIIFDVTVFPDPPGPVSGPYTGYYEVMEKVNPARELYKKLRKAADKDLKKVSSLSRKNADKLRDDYRRAKGRAEELRVELLKHAKEPAPLDEPSGLSMALLFLKCENWRAASVFFLESEEELYMEGGDVKSDFVKKPAALLAGYERALFFLLYARQVDEYNLKVKATSTKSERKAVAKNNDYRVSMGLCPLQMNPKLTKAITDHLDSIKEMSHFGDTAETERPGDRIRLAGYKIRGGAGENLSETSLMESMDGWKWDGGHHRVLVEPGAVHIGVYEKNGSGMDIATGELPELPVFDYLVHFGE